MAQNKPTDAEIRDVSIRCSGLLQAVITSGADPDQWEVLLDQAVTAHRNACKKIFTRKMKGNNDG